VAANQSQPALAEEPRPAAWQEQEVQS